MQFQSKLLIVSIRRSTGCARGGSDPYPFLTKHWMVNGFGCLVRIAACDTGTPRLGGNWIGSSISKSSIQSNPLILSKHVFTASDVISNDNASSLRWLVCNADQSMSTKDSTGVRRPLRHWCGRLVRFDHAAHLHQLSVANCLYSCSVSFARLRRFAASPRISSSRWTIGSSISTR